MLKNGSIIEGNCANANDKNATQWRVETDDGLELLLNRADVKDVPRPTTADQSKYAETLEKYRGKETLELHRKVVQWCSDNGLASLVKAHRQRIVELDPSDSSWAALGYVKNDNEWIRRDLFQMRRGLQQKGARWYIPQDLAIQQANELATKTSAQVTNRVAKAIAAVRTNSAKAAEERQYLDQLTDPHAVPKLRELLVKDRSNKNNQFRLQMIEIIGRIRSAGAVDTLVDSAVFDPDAVVRAECVELLSAFGTELAVQKLLQFLVNERPDKDDPVVYNRVGEALATLGDERSLPRLLDCLVTKHMRVPPAEPGYRVGTNSTGAVQMNQGQKQKEEFRFKNEGILNALQVLSKGENFAFDEEAWRNWYAQTYAAPNPYVLRDP